MLNLMSFVERLNQVRGISTETPILSSEERASFSIILVFCFNTTHKTQPRDHWSISGMESCLHQIKSIMTCLIRLKLESHQYNGWIQSRWCTCILQVYLHVHMHIKRSNFHYYCQAISSSHYSEVPLGLFKKHYHPRSLFARIWRKGSWYHVVRIQYVNG